MSTRKIAVYLLLNTILNAKIRNRALHFLSKTEFFVFRFDLNSFEFEDQVQGFLVNAQSLSVLSCFILPFESGSKSNFITKRNVMFFFHYKNIQKGFLYAETHVSLLNPYHLWWYRVHSLAKKDVQVHFRQQNVWPWIYNSNSLWSGNRTHTTWQSQWQIVFHAWNAKQTIANVLNIRFNLVFIYLLFYVYFPDFNWMWKFRCGRTELRVRMKLVEIRESHGKFEKSTENQIDSSIESEFEHVYTSYALTSVYLYRKGYCEFYKTHNRYVFFQS